MGGSICLERRAWGMSTFEAGATDPQQLLLLEVAYAALDGAANCRAMLVNTHVGVYVGVSGTSLLAVTGN